MPLRNLGREVANLHGWQRTGRKIMDRVEHALGAAELHEIGMDLKASEDPAGDLARHLGLSRVSGSARQQIEEIMRWYGDQTGKEDSAHS